jgi:alpha-L-fucosidase
MPRDVPDGPWELCLTIGDTWGYSPTDTRRKSPRSLAATLSQVVSRGGNLLLNISPSGSGALPDYQVETVQALGAWVQEHREALLGVEAAPDVDFYGPVTRRRHEDGSESIYLHLLALPVETVTARRLPVARIQAATLLATGARLSIGTAVDVHGSGGAERLGEVQIAAPPPSGALVDVVRIDLAPAS